MGVVEREIGSRAEWLSWRESNVNASEGACLFSDDAHPYLTAYKLWALRSGLIQPDPDNPTLRRGRLLEPVAIELLSEERPGWQVWRPHVYLSDPEARIGATPDCYAERQDGARRTRGNVQIKTAGHFAFRKNWIDPETRLVEIPLWIAIQSSIEAHLSQVEWTAVAVMAVGDGGVDFHVDEIPIKPHLITRFKQLVGEFWDNVQAKREPKVDFDRDIDTLFEIYAEGDGSTVDLTGDIDIAQKLAARRAFAAHEAQGREAEKERRKIDAQLIHRMGNATSMRVGPVLVVANTVKNKGYTVEPFQYRPVRIKDGKGRIRHR